MPPLKCINLSSESKWRVSRQALTPNRKGPLESGPFHYAIDPKGGGEEIKRQKKHASGRHIQCRTG